MPDFEFSGRRQKAGEADALVPMRLSLVSPTRVQPKLAVGAASDPLEAEADRVASSVVTRLARGPAVVEPRGAQLSAESTTIVPAAHPAGDAGPSSRGVPGEAQRTTFRPRSRIRPASTTTAGGRLAGDSAATATGQRIRRRTAPVPDAEAVSAGPADVSRAPRIPRRLNVTPAQHPVVQRYVVPQVTIPGMTGPLDTTQLDAAKVLIDQLFTSGRRDSLVTLFGEILQHDGTNRTLKDYITKYVKGTPSDEPSNATSGIGEKLALTAKYVFADTSNLGVQAGLRMWVSGDPTRGIGWKMICNHLRGLLTAQDYQQVGTLHYLIEDQNNHTNLEAGYTNPQRVLAAQTVLNNAVQTINGALGALPAHDSVSYRQSGVATATTYGTTIRVGDVLRDTAFWSTSALRISGSAGGWGTNGTLAAPKVYFLITGSTGKYISKYAAQEEGQHEVLFSNNICFRVDRIANYGNHTIFVSITEVPAVGLNLAKNPYDGSAA